MLKATFGQTIKQTIALDNGTAQGLDFEMIADESAHGLMRLGIEQRLCIGNGIMACENEDEALRLADFSRGDAGGEAARACVALMQWRARLDLRP